MRGDLGFSPIGTLSISLNVNDVVWNDGTNKQTTITQTQTTLTRSLFSSGASSPFDTTRPTVSSLIFADSDSHAKVSVGDTITITFSEPIDPSDISTGLVPGGPPIVIADGATGDVSLAKTTGVLTVKDIATVDLDAGQTKEDAAYAVSATLSATENSYADPHRQNKRKRRTHRHKTVERRECDPNAGGDASGNLLAVGEGQSTVHPAQSAKKITTFSLRA